ncbi:hypothetical protein Plec18167_006150 [Paecilomyces lecythidis]|uniref:Uncharacterized protein n=1 Tax=Paecilomyces lecythidis TaxID=3004212 RepID=A0ABR3XCE8_9EURO
MANIRPDIPLSIRRCFEHIYFLSNEDIYNRWQAPIGLVFHRFQHVLDLRSSYTNSSFPPLEDSQGIDEQSDERIRTCFRVVYTLPLESLHQWRWEISVLFSRCRRFDIIRLSLQGVLAPYQYLEEVRRNLNSIQDFFNERRLPLITRFSGDPQASLLNLKDPPYSQFLDVLYMRHHAQAYAGMAMDVADRLPGLGDRRASQLSNYIASVGGDSKRVERGTKIGRKLSRIEHGVKAPGISLVLTRNAWKLHRLNAQEIEMMIWLLNDFSQYPDILELANHLSTDLGVYQRLYDHIVRELLNDLMSILGENQCSS